MEYQILCNGYEQTPYVETRVALLNKRLLCFAKNIRKILYKSRISYIAIWPLIENQHNLHNFKSKVVTFTQII